MYELALFAGAGGGILGGILCGHTCIGAVEIEEYPREVLKQRQRDGILSQFPIWDDICTFRSDNPECSEYFELLRSIAGELVISGGFPCQDISAAGKGAGITGSRSGLWGEMARIIGEVRPRFAFVENSPLLVSRGLTTVLGDLAELGYDARWCVLGADDAGAPHRRKRIWIVAHADKFNRRDRACRRDGEKVGNGSCSWWLHDPADMADTEGIRINGEHGNDMCEKREDWTGTLKHDGSREYNGKKEGPAKPELGRVAHGVAHRVDRLKAIGNGQVPAVVRLAWRTLTGTGGVK